MNAMKISVVSIIVNILLSVAKLIAGVVACSGAMISDAIHSASDVVSTMIVIVGIKMSGRESDDGHQYGHDRMECIASIILSVILFVTGAMLGYGAFVKIISGNYDELAIPGQLALWAAVLSIAVKEWMYHFTMHTAKKINSTALKADAWHHRSDSLSSVGSFIGIFGAMLGFRVLDPVASFVICLFILKASVDIFKQATDQMVDKSCDDETVLKIREIVLAVKGVESIDLVKTRMFGPKIYVDIEFGADGNMSLYEAHRIAETVHDKIEKELPQVKHCMVHVNPLENKKPERNDEK